MAAPTLSPAPISTPLTQKDGTATPTWARWLNQLQAMLGGLTPALHPPTPTLLQQTGALYMGSGAPSNADGSNGDVYFRTDTPGTATQRIYVKAAGSWAGIL